MAKEDSYFGKKTFWLGLFIGNTKWGVKQRDDLMSILTKLVYFSTGFIVILCNTLPTLEQTSAQSNWFWIVS